VDALTRANIAILDAAAMRAGRHVEFVTLSGPMLADCSLPDRLRIGPAIDPRAMLKGRSAFLAELRAADLVVDIGEGDSWTDIYGLRRFIFLAATKTAALALKKPLVLAPQTIGPFDMLLTRIVSNFIMRRASAVFARDGLSSEYLRQQMPDLAFAEYIDVAFALPFTRSPHQRGARLRVGLNVSGLLYRGGYTGQNEFGLTLDYRELTDRLIEALLARGNVDVELVPHVAAPSAEGDVAIVDDDQSIIADILARHPAVHAAGPFADSIAAKSHISGLDFLIGARMHACIAAFSASVPVVPIAYSRKFNGLFSTLGYPYYVDGRASSTDDAFVAIMRWFDNRAQLDRALVDGIKIAGSRLATYENRLAKLIGGLP
jgi:polysaccharide pyruvyl transferase WcaK-like protein